MIISIDLYNFLCEEEKKMKEYNPDFVSEVKTRFPHWKEMHQWLDWNDPCALVYVQERVMYIYKKFQGSIWR